MTTPLPKSVKIGYGAADVGLSGALLLVQLYLFEFYTRVVGLSPGWVGLAVALAILWDAVSDPLMGQVCDQTRSRFGRTVPYLVGGGLLLPFALALLFYPPIEAPVALRFFHLLGSYLFLNTVLTVVGVPHMAMGAALSSNSNERTELYGWRLIFGTLGLFLGIAAPLLVVAAGGGETDSSAGLATSRQLASFLVGGLFWVFLLWTLGATWRRSATGPKTGQSMRRRSLKAGIRAVLSNAQFRPLLIAFLLVSIGRAMNGLLALPYYKYSLDLPESVVQRWILGIFALCIVVSVALWVGLSRRFGKKWPGFAGMLTLGLLTTFAYPLFPQGRLTGPLVAAVIGGIAVGAVILFESMVTDVVDSDRARTGQSREGAYFGMWRMGQKLASSLGVLFTAIVLEVIGYREGLAAQPESVERGLAWLFGPGVGVFFVAGALWFARASEEHGSVVGPEAPSDSQMEGGVPC